MPKPKPPVPPQPHVIARKLYGKMLGGSTADSIQRGLETFIAGDEADQLFVPAHVAYLALREVVELRREMRELAALVRAVSDQIDELDLDPAEPGDEAEAGAGAGDELADEVPELPAEAVETLPDGDDVDDLLVVEGK